MGNYRDLYEKYYKSLNEKIKYSGNLENGNDEFKDVRRSYVDNYRGNKKRKGGAVNIIYTQTVGVLTITLIIITSRYFPNTQINKVYLDMKEMVSYSEDIENMDIVETFSSFKEKVYNIGKELTEKESEEDESLDKDANKDIKELGDISFMPPVIGDIENFEDGIVIRSKEGKDVFAVLDGVVKGVKKDKDKATIIIEHKDGLETHYENITEVLVKEKDKVEVGTCIGRNLKISKDKYEVKFKVKYKDEFKDPKKYIVGSK